MGPLEWAGQALTLHRAILDQLEPNDLDRPTPCRDYSVADVTGHLVRSMRLLHPGPTPSDAPTSSIDARPSHELVVPQALHTLDAWHERGLDGAAQIGSTTYRSEQVVHIISLELLVHAWDLGSAIGVEISPDPALVDHVRAAAPHLITSAKRGRAFGPEGVIADDATAWHQLLAFTGRSPMARPAGFSQ